MPTDETFIDAGGVRYIVRVLSGLRRKDEARRAQDAAAAAGRNVNPFLPPEPALTVGEVSDTHVAVLNKFNVVERHLLIVTKRFEDQETLLTPADWLALWTCMAEYDSLGFYNGGKEGGASQEHKHLQVVPLPFSSTGPAVPAEPLLASATFDRNGMGTIPAFPFRHSFVRLEPDLWKMPDRAAEVCFQYYVRMLQHAGMTPPLAEGLTRQSLPYCLLVTREWMLLVPRSREHFGGISLNSLAYAGSFFVRDPGQLEELRAAGPLQALAAVALPR
jgi:ATP adenylyltransferase